MHMGQCPGQWLPMEAQGFQIPEGSGGMSTSSKHGVLVVADVEEAISMPIEMWAGRCHQVSLAIVKAGIVEGRVARGGCQGVGCEHSWIVCGDCYDPEATVVDPTLWCWDQQVTGIWIGRNLERHAPKGLGSIWEYGRPSHHGGRTIELAYRPEGAGRFLDLVGPLDIAGWLELANAPVGGWPCAGVLGAMVDTPGLAELVPIDIVGMMTDRNPSGLYF